MLVKSRGGVGWGVVAILVTLLVLVAGCQGSDGAQGPPGTSTGTVSGTVTSSIGGKPLAGVAVTTEPAIKDVTMTTDASGGYSGSLPIGTYSVTFKKDNFTAATLPVTLVAGQTAAKSVALKPVKAVVVNAGQDQQVSPSAVVTLSATALPLNDSTVTGYQWTQTAGVSATIDNPKSSTVKVTLDKAPTYKAELIKILSPLVNRVKVLAISPLALEEAEIATFEVTVTTSSGSYKDAVNVTVALPYVINTGLQAVPKGVPVLLQGKEQVGYSWTLMSPAGSKATLNDANDRFPSFTPDIVGKYTLNERNNGASIDVYAGTWAGAISGQDSKGEPLAAGCTVCHNGKIAPDNFTDWKASGHAEIFTQNINNPDGHWTVSCASCHTVGYAPGVDNGGFDEAIKAEGWQAPAHGDVGLWTTILAKNPKTAKLANIQCENCHGPNDSVLHGNKIIDAARVSVSADVCGACHGEPPRHGRFQQWEESAHSGIESATTPERGTSSSCGRCHLAQGFLTWLKQGDLTKQVQGANGNATVDEMLKLGASPDVAEGVTCVVCHDPHAQGKLSGEPNTATIRIQGDTKMLPSGFQAKAVGKGALCITCHNTRNALHNDANAPTSYSAPHVAAQGDVMMGENAYFVESQRSPHANIKDTCVTCHMEASPPPAEFSYNQSGTNHSFAPSIKICSSCHSDTLNGHALQVGVEDKLHKLGEAMSAYLLKKMPARVTMMDYTPHVFGGKSYDVKSVALSVAKDNIAALEPTEPHGQQGFLIKFKTPLTFTYNVAGESPHTMSLSEVEVQLGDVTDGTTSLVAFTDPLVKAGWNYFLLHGDASEGIHNPAFTTAVIDASIKALK
ncbi:MAG: hypothetical protein HW402_160 [Dehalococcoidales bacterium]|nr:hypothetical protein [Dehalococcoidales bacterium]